MSPVMVVASCQREHDECCQEDPRCGLKDLFHLFLSFFVFGVLLTPAFPGSPFRARHGIFSDKIDNCGPLFSGKDRRCHVPCHQLSFVIHPHFVGFEMPPDDGPSETVVGIDETAFRFSCFDGFHILGRELLCNSFESQSGTFDQLPFLFFGDHFKLFTSDIHLTCGTGGVQKQQRQQKEKEVFHFFLTPLISMILPSQSLS